MNTEIKIQIENLTEIQHNIDSLKREAKKINESLYFEAMSLLKEVSIHEEINGLEYLNTCEIKGGDIYYSGEDKFRGETDYYSFDLDVELLYDKKEKEAYINELIKEKSEEEHKRKNLEIQIQLKKEAKELAIYKKLKKQFENK